MICYTLDSQSQPGQSHTVRLFTGVDTVTGSNVWTCTCKGFKFSSQCRHIEAATRAFRAGLGSAGTTTWPLGNYRTPAEVAASIIA
jgi:hypothetical protein